MRISKDENKYKKQNLNEKMYIITTLKPIFKKHN